MSDIYDMVEKTPEQLKSEVETKPQESNNGGSRFEEPVYEGINLEVDTLQRNNKCYYIHSEVEVPDEAKETLNRVIDRLSLKEWTLRINPEDRNNKIAKHAFIKAAYKEVFLPWADMNKSIQPIIKRPTKMAHNVAIWTEKQLFKSDADKYNDMKSFFKAFRANFIHLLLGEGCNAPIEFAIIYTPCGTSAMSKDVKFKELGFDISKILRLSTILDFRVFNLGSNDSMMELEQYLSSVVEG